MPSLIPSSGTNIIDTSLPDYTSGVISTDLDNPVWEFTLTPIGNAPDDVIDINFTVVIADAVTVNYINKNNLFPITRLDYINDNRELITVYNLSDLPDDPNLSPRITKYIPSNKNYVEWDLSVSVTGTETTPEDPEVGGGPTVTEHTLNGSYIIHITANYNENINILRGLLDERDSL